MKILRRWVDIFCIHLSQQIDPSLYWLQPWPKEGAIYVIVVEAFVPARYSSIQL